MTDRNRYSSEDRSSDSFPNSTSDKRLKQIQALLDLLERYYTSAGYPLGKNSRGFSLWIRYNTGTTAS